MARYAVLLLVAAKRAVLDMDAATRASTAECLRDELDAPHDADVAVTFVGVDCVVRPLSNGWSAVFRPLSSAELRSMRGAWTDRGFAVHDLLSAEEALSTSTELRRALRRPRRS